MVSNPENIPTNTTSTDHAFLYRQVRLWHEFLLSRNLSWKPKEDTNANIDYLVSTERDDLKKILSINKYLQYWSIVWDLEVYNKQEWWKDHLFVKYTPKYGLNVPIYDFHKLLSYCATHSFIPMFDKIIINGKDVSMIKEFYELFFLALTCQDWTILNSLSNDFERILANRPDLKPAIDKILPWIDNFTTYQTYVYTYLYNQTLWKVKHRGSVSERIFSEATWKIENDIIKNVWVKSSYMWLPEYNLDHKDVTDLIFKFRKTRKQPFRRIWVQLTMITDEWKLAEKEKKVEGCLFTKTINTIRDSNFILLSINWEFENQAKSIAQEYNDRRSKPPYREKSSSSEIPLFVDTLDPEKIKPAYVIDIALNMLYKNFTFKFSDKENYIDSCRKEWNINRKNSSSINGIQLNKIVIDSAEVEKLEYTWDCPTWHDLLKHKYSISYEWKKMWTIIIYGLPINNQKWKCKH